MNTTTTFNLAPFAKVSCPCFNGWSVSNKSVPSGEGIFNRKFYMLSNGKIVAFKILAWAFGAHAPIYYQKLAYLIQTPTSTEWHYFTNEKFFTSIEDIVSGGEPYKIPTISMCSVLHPIKGCVKERTESFEIMKSYYYSTNDSKVELTNTKITHILGTEDGVFIGLEQREGKFKATKEEVLAEQFNGVEIVDFADPVMVEIKFEIPSTTIVTKRLVLK